MSESRVSACPSPPFLGVGRSALGRVWYDRCDQRQAGQALAIAQAHGVPDLLARVLAGRDVPLLGVPGHLEPKLRDLLPDPSVLQDMDAAAGRLARAVERRETVAIFGDYDVDGACSAALLAGYLGRFDVPCRVHIPDRITEGYGPNDEAIRALAAAGATLLVAVDCGTASHGPFAVARELGLDVVVLDHHQAPETLPATLALVNPNRQDDMSGLGHLCAAGIVFLTLVALQRELRRRGIAPAKDGPDLLADLDLVALATIADVVPLVGLNRAFVRQGLQLMRQRRRPGLTALADIADLKGPPQAWHLGFLLGPRINAGGRIGDAALGSRLLLTEDPGEARRIAETLDGLNRERQAIEQVAVEEAIAQALLQLDRDPSRPLIVVASPEWHPGIVGLVAARVRERFGLPAFALALRPDGSGTGSGRSVPGADLGRAVRRAVDMGAAVKGGGHAMAAGVTLAAGMVDTFAATVGACLAEGGVVAEADRLDVDAALTAGGARPELVAMLERAGPFGSGNPEPVFALPHHRLVDVQPVGSAHIRARLRSGDGSSIGAVAFRAAGQPLGEALLAARGELVHVVGTLAVDRWGGSERAEMRLRDMARVDAARKGQGAPVSGP